VSEIYFSRELVSKAQSNCAKTIAACCVAISILNCFATSAQSATPPANAETKSNLVDRPKRELFTPVRIESLDASTRELAEQLEIYPMLQELYGTKNI